MITIRAGKRRDLPRVLELIKELAKYERAAHEVSNAVAMMETDGFGVNQSMDFVAEEEQSFKDCHFTITGIQPGKASGFISRILS